MLALEDGNMRVRDVMTSPAHTVSPDTPAWEAVGVMRKLRIRRLPVVEDGALVGIVTWTDLVRVRPPAIGGRWTMPNLAVAASVRHLMTTDPITARPDMSVEDAAAIMRRRKIGGLPVIEQHRVVGIVTESDLFDFFVEAFTARPAEAHLHIGVECVAEHLPGVVKVLTDASIPIAAIYTVRRKGYEAIDVMVRKRDAARARKALGEPAADEARTEPPAGTLVFE
jgi:acetoin utilization protein AcuB